MVTRKPNVSTAIRIPTDLHGRLLSEASQRELSINFLVVRAIEDYLQRLIPVDVLISTREGVR